MPIIYCWQSTYILTIVACLHVCFPQSCVFYRACTIVQSAVLRSHVVCLSIRPSVRNVGGSGSHTSEILETNCTHNQPNTFLFVAQRPSIYSQGNMGKFWEARGGVGKMVCWSTKAAISLCTPPKTPITIISGTGKATKFKFCMHIYRLNRNKSPLKISGKVAVGVVRDSRKFLGHPYIGRIAWLSLRQLSFLVQ